MTAIDSLVEIPFEKWSELMDVYGTNGTISVPYYFTIKLNIKYSKLKDASNLKLKLYSPFGNTDQGLVLISEKGHTEVVIMPLSDENNKLFDAIVRTNRIDWSRKITVNLLCPRAVTVLKKLRPKLGLNNCDILPTTTFYYRKDMQRFSAKCLPDDVYLRPVKLEDILQVDNSWPYKHSASHFYFSVLASNDLSYGIYSRADHTLRAWVFINEYGFICNLYCEEAYRRRGYAKHLIKHLVNNQIDAGEGAYALVVKGNVESFKLFQDLYFKIIEPSFYAYINK